ncbi:MAG: DEAD/DEAH box helicase family protein [bacterium]|nr:DEAD/DEAH box helicase family protein [bacterium]
MTKDEIDRLAAELEKQLEELDSKRIEIQEKIRNLSHQRKAFTVAENAFSQSLDRPLSEISSVSQKIALFRSFFKGREDLYAQRWESTKTGKTGYQPVCKHDWIRGICRKPEIKCGNCAAREFVPISDNVIHRHLFGFVAADHNARRTRKDFVIGVYPLLQNETCWFLAADFDKESWKTDVSAFRSTCRRFNVPSAVERSRSGNGAHAWIFFSEPIPAISARRLGSFLLTETLDERPEIGLDSYDRLIPNQDTLPDGGLGSLIALPLQYTAIEKGNCVFIDENYLPFSDQWLFLATLPKMVREEVEHIVAEAHRKGKIIGIRLPMAEEEDEEPWKALPSRRRKEIDISGPLPEKVIIRKGDLIYIDKEDLPAILRSRLFSLAAFQNPEFYKAQAMRFSTYGKPRIISCAEDFVNHIGLPRGCLEEAVELFRSLKIDIDVIDERYPGIPIECEFLGMLRPEQEAAVNSLLEHDTGVLAAATAFGKTVVAAKVMAHRAVNTLVLVHRRQLLDQWIAQLMEFLDLKTEEIGSLGSGKRKLSKIVDIAIIQSLCRKGIVDDIVGEYGHLVVDECHHIPAVSFEQVLRKCKSKYILGLSATVTRKDGHHPIIFMQCGPVRFRVGAKQGTQAHPFQHRVVLRNTKFTFVPSKDTKLSIHEIYDALMTDEARNELIFEDILKSIAEDKRSPILITERRRHLEMFAERFRPFVRNIVVFKGGMGQRQRQKIREQLNSIKDDDERLLIATGKYLGEGFDDARLDTLFLTLPISWKGTLAQYAGRLHRSHYNKKEVRIYDYVDLKVPMLERMYKRRLQGYRAIGYEIE